MNYKNPTLIIRDAKGKVYMTTALAYITPDDTDTLHEIRMAAALGCKIEIYYGDKNPLSKNFDEEKEEKQ